MDVEALLTSEQKAEIVKAAILRHAEEELTGAEFHVKYDRRYASIFSATRVANEDDRPARALVEVVFSISPVNYSMDTFFQNAAREAARAIIDILNLQITAANQPRPSNEVKCPCCEATIRVVTGG